MIGIVLVSHSAALAEGLADLASQIAGGEVRIVAAGGGPDGTLGTNGDRIAEAIVAADAGSGVLPRHEARVRLMAKAGRRGQVSSVRYIQERGGQR